MRHRGEGEEERGARCVRVPRGNDTQYKCRGMVVMGLLMWKRYLHCRRDLAVGLAQGASVRVIADGEGFCRLPR